MAKVHSFTTNKKLELFGVKELQAHITRLNDAIAGQEARKVVGDAAGAVRSAVETNARAVHVPHEVLDDVFSYNKPARSGKENGPTALVGIRKAGRNFDAHAYVTWYPSRQTGDFEKTQRTKARGRGASLVRPGTAAAKGSGLQRIGESLATMWEIGTTKKEPTAFFSNAVRAATGLVLERIKAGYLGILNRYSRAA